jgi:hypothetical protein
MLVLPEQFQRDVAELLDILSHPKPEDPTIAEESFVVLGHLEDKELRPAGVPVCADAFEDPGPIVEGIGADADLGFVARDELVVEIGKRRHRQLPRLSERRDSA